MIRKAKFENFKGLRDVEITFESRFTVLVGPNGTGKTSVLQGVELAAWPRVAPETELALGYHRSRGTTEQLRLTLIDELESGWRIDFPVLDQTGATAVPYRDGSPLDPKLGGSIEPPVFAPTFRPKYDSGEIAEPAASNSAPLPILVKPSGRGLPALLGYLKLRDDETFDRIESTLRELIPNVVKIRLDELNTFVEDSGYHVVEKAILFDTRNAKHIPARQMSDGTLYILALVAAVVGPDRPKTLLIDDIDQRLHPKAQYELVTLLKKFLVEFPDLQIIATSHSPYILDRLDASEVLVTELADDGSVVVAPLTAHPTYQKWSESMTPGEFWSHTGEGWVKQLKREPATP